MIEVTDLKTGDYPGLSGGLNLITKVCKSGKNQVSDCMGKTWLSGVGFKDGGRGP